MVLAETTKERRDELDASLLGLLLLRFFSFLRGNGCTCSLYYSSFKKQSRFVCGCKKTLFELLKAARHYLWISCRVCALPFDS